MIELGVEVRNHFFFEHCSTFSQMNTRKDWQVRTDSLGECVTNLYLAKIWKRSSCECLWGFRVSVVSNSIVLGHKAALRGNFCPDISKETGVFIFKGLEVREECGLPDRWRWSYCVPLRVWKIVTHCRIIEFRKTCVLNKIPLPIAIICIICTINDSIFGNLRFIVYSYIRVVAHGW